ncbi:DUF1697 domain-containing protein [Streptomyces syringium]|uniref:DUF1697 domain-containing protein n=1 Tax=Streptomyces syringium TaxID=76729 RepID=UPI0037D5B397
MTTYVALLRGINVGTKQRVPMRTLRDLLSGLGCGSVRTHLNSGNAVFTHPGSDPDALAAGLEEAIGRELGLSVRCFVREGVNLRRVVDANPFADRAIDPARFLVVFLSGSSSSSGAARPDTFADLDPGAYAPDEFALGEREVYLICPDGIRDSKLAKLMTGRRLREDGTARNWNTVTRLADMADETAEADG